ncbi:transcription factor LBX1-like [Lineus longissimus]|uniref:transcription factor LBX1-like n=1 Tax=Lineus longissimus TaxID=88925 RepID=UPI002B4D16FD
MPRLTNIHEDSPHGYGPIRKLAMVQPPRNPEKPLTSFTIRDILNIPSRKSDKSGTRSREFQVGIVRPWNLSLKDQKRERDWESDEEIDVVDEPFKPQLRGGGLMSPLDALLRMANKTFEGLNNGGDIAHDLSKRDQMHLFGKSQPPKKRRKSRTAFTNHQIYELEKRFLYQKYLTPADRDEIAQSLGLSNAQVITWFQNRRAKLKRDLEELKADVTHTSVVKDGGPDVVDGKKKAKADQVSKNISVNVIEREGLSSSTSESPET